MKRLTLETFSSWLEVYGRASIHNYPQDSAELFTHNAEYCETPFDAPMIGHDTIRKYLEIAAQTFKEKEASYEVLLVGANPGIARCRSKSVVINSSKRLALKCWHLKKPGCQPKTMNTAFCNRRKSC